MYLYTVFPFAIICFGKQHTNQHTNQPDGQQVNMYLVTM